MRQHRLLATVHLLSEADSLRLAKAMVALREAVSTQVVRAEAKATQELKARTRQWRATVDELAESCDETVATYASAAEARAMAAALVAFLSSGPFRLDPQLEEALAETDRELLSRWIDGPFVWPSIWQPAYPQPSYWWLFGRPCDEV
jgi:hypothetical protein